MTLPADAHIGSVSLTVSDLGRSVPFYRDILDVADVDARVEVTLVGG